MTAIVLAAGRGSRLGPVTAQTPKCLLPVGGQRILDHMLDRIDRAGIRDVLIVAGFEAARVQRHVESRVRRGFRVRVLVNQRFADTNNLYSLWLALKATSGPVTILNGDDVFNVNILTALLKCPAPSAAAVDFSWPLPGDAMRVRVEAGAVAALGKQLPVETSGGNAIGLYRFGAAAALALRSEVSRWVDDGRVQAFYVAAIDALAPRLGLAAVSTSGLTWGEVDDARDLEAAPAKMAAILHEEARARRGTARRGTIPARLEPTTIAMGVPA